MNVISKKNLLQGIGSILEVYPACFARTRRAQVLKAHKVKAKVHVVSGQHLDAVHLQSDWGRVGEYLGNAVRAHDQEQRNCT